jgi:hypothetical protein
MDTLYHYTIGFHIPRIVGDGALRPIARHPGSRIAVLWLSTHPRWEPSAVKTVTDERGREIIIGLDQLVTRGRGVFRFEVEPTQRLLGWREYVELSAIDREFAEHLDTSGRQGGADPAQWRACLHEVPRGEWRRIEMWQAETQAWAELV